MKHSLMSELLKSVTGPRLIICGGRPNMGKTTVMLNLAGEALNADNKSVLFISIAGSLDNVTEKLKTLCELENADIEYCVLSKPHVSLSNILNSIRSARNSNTRLTHVFIDYLGLIGANEFNCTEGRKEEVQVILTHLQTLSRELNLTIIIADITDRNSNPANNDRRPQPNNLRYVGESQFIDDYLLIYRPSYYDTSADQHIEIAHFQYEHLKSKSQVYTFFLE